MGHPLPWGSVTATGRRAQAATSTEVLQPAEKVKNLIKVWQQSPPRRKGHISMKVLGRLMKREQEKKVWKKSWKSDICLILVETYIDMFFFWSRWCCFFLAVSKGRRVGHLWWSAGKWSHHVLKDHMPFLQPGTTQVLLHCRVDQPERCWNIAIFCNVPVEWFSILS